MTACACIRQLFHQSDDARRVLQQPLLQVIASLHPSNFALPCSTFEAQNWKFDVGSSTLEVRRWKFDVGSSTLEVRRWKFDVGSSTFVPMNSSKSQLRLPPLSLTHPADCAPQSPAGSLRAYKSASSRHPDAPANPAPCEYPCRPPANAWRNYAATYAALLVCPPTGPAPPPPSPPAGRCPPPNGAAAPPHRPGPAPVSTPGTPKTRPTAGPPAHTCVPAPTAIARPRPPPPYPR